MKNYDIYGLYETIQALMQKDISTKTGFILLKNKNKLEPSYSAIKESRLNIIKKYSIAEEDGTMHVPENKINEANNELQEILDMEADKVNLQKIKLEDLPSELPLEIINGLMPIIDEE